MTLQNIENVVFRVTGLSVRKKSRKRNYLDSKRLFIALSQRYSFSTQQDIAEYLNITEGAVRNAIKRHHEQKEFNLEYRFQLKEAKDLIENRSFLLKNLQN